MSVYAIDSAKPLGDWTLKEAKTLCATYGWGCEKDRKPCPFYLEGGECRIGDGKSPHRFKLTEEEKVN